MIRRARARVARERHRQRGINHRWRAGARALALAAAAFHFCACARIHRSRSSIALVGGMRTARINPARAAGGYLVIDSSVCGMCLHFGGTCAACAWLWRIGASGMRGNVLRRFVPHQFAGMAWHGMRCGCARSVTEDVTWRGVSAWRIL